MYNSIQVETTEQISRVLMLDGLARISVCRFKLYLQIYIKLIYIFLLPSLICYTGSGHVENNLYISQTLDENDIELKDVINYTIYYRNDFPQTIENASLICDISPVDDLTANPAPTTIIENSIVWYLGSLPSGYDGIISISVNLPKKINSIIYNGESIVDGYGYFNSRNNFKITENKDRFDFTSYINFTALFQNETYYYRSSLLIPANQFPCANLSISRHGSGKYLGHEIISLNGSNLMDVRIKDIASHSVEVSNISPNDAIAFDSKWETKMNLNSKKSTFNFNNEIIYSEDISSDISILLDHEPIDCSLKTSFSGIGQKKLSFYDPKNHDVLYSANEYYHGNFSTKDKIYADDGYLGIKTLQSTSGNGIVSIEKNLFKNIKSYESGSGKILLNEIISGPTGSINKYINLTKQNMVVPLTLSQQNTSIKWIEGTSVSKVGRETQLYDCEKTYYLDYLKKDISVKNWWNIKANYSFEGASDFQLRYNSKTGSGVSSESYLGEYNLTRGVTISEGLNNNDHISIYQCPRIYLGINPFVIYNITIYNDGNTNLNGIYVEDIIPKGTEYSYSSLKSREYLNSRIWSYQDQIKPGDNFTIELKLNITQKTTQLINKISVGTRITGGILSESFEATNLNWTNETSLDEPLIDKEYFIDPEEPKLIKCRIKIKNNKTNSIYLQIFDYLPVGISFLNSSIPFIYDNTNNYILFRDYSIPPKNTSYIDYYITATNNGTYLFRSYAKGTRLGKIPIKDEVYTCLKIGPVTKICAPRPINLQSNINQSNLDCLGTTISWEDIDNPENYISCRSLCPIYENNLTEFIEVDQESDLP
jgi:uncharacterized repeat protein (TIGR01451 family)